MTINYIIYTVIRKGLWRIIRIHLEDSQLRKMNQTFTKRHFTLYIYSIYYELIM
jgi:hypothetical protein